MDEIEKIKKTIDRNIVDVDTEVLMVIDATTGQNAVEQVKAFYDKTSVDGIILTKLDSTAKGGVVFSIINELRRVILEILAMTLEGLKAVKTFSDLNIKTNVTLIFNANQALLLWVKG